MKLWLLRPNEGFPNDVNTNPWSPWYDKAFGFVIRAETEEQARQLATANAGNEIDQHQTAWLNAKYSTCVELTAEGEVGEIIRDYASA